MAAGQPFDRLHPVLQHHIVNTLGWPALRPLQSESIEPVLDGADAILLAPTAGGKTEAALFPLLTRMEREQWEGVSVLYVCPLKALLNNLQPRLETYAGWLGRAASTRHGDTSSGVRRQQVHERPSILLTTPESIEAMLVSRAVDARRMFADLRAVVVDEVHALAGDDRGWHLLAVLERLEDLAGRSLQRVGLSATVGNAAELLGWLQGSDRGSRSTAVVAPPVETVVVPQLALDFVGNVGNAAKVLSQLYLGEKRLVFADSRRTVEDLAVQLRGHAVETFVSHSSLSLDERRRAEAAFAEGRDCVIVSTSTLELGIDVGDLDRVIQLGAPNTVASLLQRLGRTGRRSGTIRNMTFLALDDAELVRSAALLLLLGEGFVESVVAPPEPRHVAAQQLLGSALQKSQIDLASESAWIAKLGLASIDELARIEQWLLDTGHLDVDSGLAFVGPTADKRYGPRNFMELLAIFTATPEVTVLHGRTEIGSVDPVVLTSQTDGPRVIALAGRPWQVTHVDWKRRRAYVELSDQLGRSKWSGDPRPYSYTLSDAIRRLLLGSQPAGVELSQRAVERLARVRGNFEPWVSDDATVIAKDGTRVRWWTFAGGRANAVLTATLGRIAPDLLDESVFSNLNISLKPEATAVSLRAALREARRRFGDDLSAVAPEVSQQALKKLKFSELLPPDLALQTLAARGADWKGAAAVARRPVIDATGRTS